MYTVEYLLHAQILYFPHTQVKLRGHEDLNPYQTSEATLHLLNTLNSSAWQIDPNMAIARLHHDSIHGSLVDPARAAARLILSTHLYPG